MDGKYKQPARTGVAQDFERIRELVETMREMAERYKDQAAMLRQFQSRMD